MMEVFNPGRRICVVLLSGIGDAVHGLPIVNALKRDDPDRHITWIVQSEPAPLLRPHPAVDDVLIFDRKQGLGELRRLWSELRPKRFHVVLNLNIYFKAAVPTFIARAPHKVGFGRDRARDLVWLVANHRLPARAGHHVQDRYLEFLEYLGIPTEPIEWRITLTAGERRAQHEYFARFEGKQTVGIVVTSGRAAKDWSTARFAEVATACECDLGFKVILLGGPGARERRRAREVSEASEANLAWELGPDLRRLIYLIDGLDLMIAPDTGPLHIARALGKPIIGLFGHTNPLEVGPYRACEDLWIDRYNFDAPSRPSALEGSGGREGRMPLISVSAVLEKVELARERYLSPRAAGSADEATSPGR